MVKVGTKERSQVVPASEYIRARHAHVEPVPVIAVASARNCESTAPRGVCPSMSSTTAIELHTQKVDADRLPDAAKRARQLRAAPEFPGPAAGASTLMLIAAASGHGQHGPR